ncbi:N-6 DNA methylase [Flavobacterium sp. FZUC8N2.13]|uniref:N-6 DNA methylase n=1 Tax=Flavobacterium zubiriense TaxID=3138075 RepID=A0ABV4TAL7_9FLAO
MLKTRDVPKELKTFNSLFFGFEYRHDLNRVFDDLLTVIICAMGRGTQEPLYLETIKKYSRSELESLCKLFAELTKIYAKSLEGGDWCDPLGEYYECLTGNYKKSNFGQYFTPKSLCDLMAQLTIDKDDYGKTVNEPCSGSGRLVLAANHIGKGNYYVCQDLDPMCCKMTAINLCFHEIRGEVHCHNSLLMDKPRFSLATNYEFWKNKTHSILYYNND